jgi:large subunit ribosomal protein L22
VATRATDGRPEVRAEAKWVRVSPRKARLVVEHIRGRSVPEARTVLAFTSRAAAREVEKVLRSAVAAYVDEGPTIKRWRARARGRVARIKKRTCHITVKLGENPRAVAAPPKRAAQTAEKPKRAPRARKAAEPTTEETPKPKRTTTRKKKEAAK